jgi:hypothetical protein
LQRTAPRRRSGTYANEHAIASSKFEFLPFFPKARFT